MEGSEAPSKVFRGFAQLHTLFSFRVPGRELPLFTANCSYKLQMHKPPNQHEEDKPSREMQGIV